MHAQVQVSEGARDGKRGERGRVEGRVSQQVGASLHLTISRRDSGSGIAAAARDSSPLLTTSPIHPPPPHTPPRKPLPLTHRRGSLLGVIRAHKPPLGHLRHGAQRRARCRPGVCGADARHIRRARLRRFCRGAARKRVHVSACVSP
jgi:hypothetical protein